MSAENICIDEIMSSLLAIHCADKKNHHADKANPGLVPYFPCRVCAAGRSNSGKGSCMKTLICSATPAYDHIVVLHYVKIGIFVLESLFAG